MTKTAHEQQGRSLLDLAFRWGVIGKGVYGAIEMVIGILLCLVSPSSLQQWATFLTQADLARDPDALLSSWIMGVVDGLTSSAVTFAAVYLIVHGIVKVGLLLAILAKRRRVYPWAVGILIAFLGYQVFELFVHFSIGLLALSIFDAVIIVLTWREYRHTPLEVTHSPHPVFLDVSSHCHDALE